MDFWRVQLYEPNRRLRLFAEMRLPGRAWLEFRVEPEGPCTLIRQIAQFEPRGLAGLLYWYLLWPVHEGLALNVEFGLCESQCADLIAERGVTNHSTRRAQLRRSAGEFAKVPVRALAIRVSGIDGDRRQCHLHRASQKLCRWNRPLRVPASRGDFDRLPAAAVHVVQLAAAKRQEGLDRRQELAQILQHGGQPVQRSATRQKLRRAAAVRGCALRPCPGRRACALPVRAPAFAAPLLESGQSIPPLQS